MNFNYIIVEDNLTAIQNLQNALKAHSNFVEIGTAHTLSNGIELALSSKPHIIFLDVELGNENGFDLVKEIRQFANKIPFIIMTTDFEKYAKKALNLDVFYFLDKPINPEELVKALSKFEKSFVNFQTHITIKSEKDHFYIQLESIQYVKSFGNFCWIYRKNEKRLLVNRTLKSIEVALPNQFFRIHKSYIVNCFYVQMINTTKKTIKINCSNSSDDTNLPIGETYLETVKRNLL